MSADNITAREWKAIQKAYARMLNAKLNAGIRLIILRDYQIGYLSRKDGIDTFEVIKQLLDPRPPNIQWRGWE
jgi:hypothetical protein